MINRADRFLAVGATALALVCGCYFFSLARPGLNVRWVQEQIPPEPAAALELDPNGEVLARTASGHIYEIFPGWEQSWEPYGGVGETNRHGVYCSQGDGHGYIILPPPGDVVSRVSENCVATESGYFVEVILLENGEVWTWLDESSAFGGTFLFLFLLAGFVPGVVILVIGGVMKFYDR